MNQCILNANTTYIRVIVWAGKRSAQKHYVCRQYTSRNSFVSCLFFSGPFSVPQQSQPAPLTMMEKKRLQWEQERGLYSFF